MKEENQPNSIKRLIEKTTRLNASACLVRNLF